MIYSLALHMLSSQLPMVAMGAFAGAIIGGVILFYDEPQWMGHGS